MPALLVESRGEVAGRRNRASATSPIRGISPFLESSSQLRIVPCPVTGRPVPRLHILRSQPPHFSATLTKRRSVRGYLLAIGSKWVQRLHVDAARALEAAHQRLVRTECNGAAIRGWEVLVETLQCGTRQRLNDPGLADNSLLHPIALGQAERNVV